MDWTEEYKRSKASDGENARIAAELKLRNDRVVQEKAPDLWDGVVAQLSADCSKLGGRCFVTSGGAGSLTLTASGSPILYSFIKYMPVGHFIRVVRSCSTNGMNAVTEGVENIALELLDSDDSVAFVVNGKPLRLVWQVSEYLIKQLIEPKPRPEYERAY